MTKRVAQTERLLIRQFKLADADFLVRLLNQPSFLRYIGDREVRNIADAQAYLHAGPLASYAQHGHGLNAVVLKATGALIGMCGVLKRDNLPKPDLGYAFLPEFTGAGYAFEAAMACMQYAKQKLKIPTLLAIVQPDNAASIKLLAKLGFGEQKSEPPLWRPLLRFKVLL